MRQNYNIAAFYEILGQIKIARFTFKINSFKGIKLISIHKRLIKIPNIFTEEELRKILKAEAEKRNLSASEFIRMWSKTISQRKHPIQGSWHRTLSNLKRKMKNYF